MTIRRRAGVAALAIAVLLPLLAGCGKPAFSYVADQDRKTYYKVPNGWTEVSTDVTDAAFAEHILRAPSDLEVSKQYRKVMRSHMFEAGPLPNPYSITTLTPTDDPVLYSLVAPVPTAMQQVMSLDLMRDLFFPVTDGARQAFAQAFDGLPDFELLDDEILTPSVGLHGVRVVYNYRLESRVLHTFDLTVLTDDAAIIVYVRLVRCTSTCYRNRVVEINDIVTSFTVRSQR
jgi:hypothetical protein